MLGIRQKPVLVDKLMIPPVKHDLKLMSIGFFLDDNEPVMWRGPMLHRALEQFLQDVHWGELDALCANPHAVARLKGIRRNVEDRTIHGDMAVGDELARLVARRGKPKTVDDVVESQLEEPQEVLARHVGSTLRLLEEAAELCLTKAIDSAHLLLLAQLQAVIANLTAAHRMHAGRGWSSLERALLRVAARALQEELRPFAAALAADCTGIA